MDDLGKSFVCPVDVALLWRSFDVAAMEESGCSLVWCWTMRVVFFRPILRRALQGDPSLTTQQMCVNPSLMTPDASASFLTRPHAGLHVEGVEMSKGRGVSCQFKIPIHHQSKVRTRYNAFKATSKTHLFFPVMSTTVVISLGMFSPLRMQWVMEEEEEEVGAESTS